MRAAEAIRAYDRVAERYDRAWARYTEETLPRVVSLMTAGDGLAILDVACGTGELIRRLIAGGASGRLVGVDGSPEMVRLAQAKFQGATNVTIHEGQAEALSFANEAFNWVACCNSLHGFRDPARALHEMRRVLKAGGQLLVLDWCRNPWHCRVLNWWKVRFDASHVRMYTVEELRQLMEGCQLTVQHLERFRVSWIAGLRLWEMMLCVAGKPREGGERR